MSQAAALARIFGECREGQIPHPLGWKKQAKPCSIVCCGVFDYLGNKYQTKVEHFGIKSSYEPEGVLMI